MMTPEISLSRHETWRDRVLAICPCCIRLQLRQTSRSLHSNAAFSLVEVLVGLFVLSIAAIAITSAWRLADYQELLARVDRRAERILREYYELQTFAPASYKPFVVTGDSNQQFAENSNTGYLYHPRLIADRSGQPQFGNLIPFTISMTNGSQTGKSQLVLTYTVPSYGAQQSRQVTKTVVLNP
jgi:type II secretory pathway pseudopilin PulG